MLNLFRGHPGDDLLATDVILAATANVLGKPREGDENEDIRHPLTYGSDEGSLSVRSDIAQWINGKLFENSGETTPDCINLTNGASFGAAAALTQCCPREYTQHAFAVTPTYFLINDVFLDAGFKGRITGIVETKRCIDLDGLETQLASFPEIPLENPLWFRYVFYLVPVFSNPGGYTLSEEENRRLLAIARKYNVLLLCDNVYQMLNYDANHELPTPLVRLDRTTLPEGSFGNVIDNCSFSKYLGPGLRVGWQECATKELAYHLSQTGATKSGGTPAHLNSFLVADTIRSGSLDRVLTQLCHVYGERAKGYIAAFKKYLPEGTQTTGGEGGYFFWVRLPDQYDARGITDECESLGVVLAPGHHFEVDGDAKGWGLNCFRVSLSFHSVAEADAAIRTWGEVAQKHRRR